jgi:hypothetical protein
MVCLQTPTSDGLIGSGQAGGGGYTTEADCLQACKEGACCEGTTCSVKPQCQCQGTGKTFKGVGTTCTPNPCLCCFGTGASADPVAYVVTFQTLSISRVNAFTGAVIQSYVFRDINWQQPFVCQKTIANCGGTACCYSGTFFADDCVSRPFFGFCGGSAACSGKVILFIYPAGSGIASGMSIAVTMFDRVSPAVVFNSVDSCIGFSVVVDIPSPCAANAYPVNAPFTYSAGGYVYSGTMLIGLST